MADLTQVEASVKAVAGVSGGPPLYYTQAAAEAITNGAPVFFDTDAAGMKMSDANDTTRRKIGGVAVSSAGGVGSSLTYVTAGEVNIGSAVAVGKIYVVSRNVGKICPVEDLASGDDLEIVGYGWTTTTIMLMPLATGAIKA